MVFYNAFRVRNEREQKTSATSDLYQIHEKLMYGYYIIFERTAHDQHSILNEIKARPQRVVRGEYFCGNNFWFRSR